MFLAGLVVVLPVLVCVAGILKFLLPAWWRRGMTATVLVLVPASLLFGAAEGVDAQAYQKFEDRIEVREGEVLFVRVPLTAEFRRMLKQAAYDNPTSQIHVHYRNVARRARKPAELNVFHHAADDNRLTLPLTTLLTEIEQQAGALELTLRPAAGSGGVLLRSWQRNRPEEGRRVEILTADGTKRTVEWFPSLEIRVLRGDNGYPLKPLITQWDLTTPVGYGLVGF
jgi:hypothetical protein